MGRTLLSVVALDANKGMFLIAVGVIEIECKESWMFFFSLIFVNL